MRPARLAALLAVAILVAGPRGFAAGRNGSAGELDLRQPAGRSRGLIVFLHGFGEPPAQWQTMARWMHQRGFETLALRAPGSGEPGLPGAREAHRHAEHVTKVFDEARRRGQPIHVVGLSMGGAQAVDMVLRYGGEGSRLKTVTAVNPFFERTSWGWGPLRLSFGLFQRAFDTIDRLAGGRASTWLDRSGLRIGAHRAGPAMGLQRYGLWVAARARKVTGPRLTLILSDDPTASRDAGLRVAAATGAEVVLRDERIHVLIKEGPHHLQVLNAIRKIIEAE